MTKTTQARELLFHMVSKRHNDAIRIAANTGLVVEDFDDALDEYMTAAQDTGNIMMMDGLAQLKYWISQNIRAGLAGCYLPWYEELA